MLLRTLGGLVLEGSDFQRPKPLLLLAYLSLEGPKPRRYLADLFYSGTSDPLNGLSRGLSFLKAAVPDAFSAETQKVQTLVRCDAKNLIDLLSAKHLERGINAYRGLFLEGLDLVMGEELEEWVYGTREFLAAQVRDALLRMGERYTSQGQLDDACRCAEAAYDVPGAPELEPEDFGRTYTMLAAGASPRAAAVRRDAATFGLELTVSALPTLTGDELSERERHNLPSYKTLFVGREAELNTLSDHLLDEACRLITVLGPGGIGKSRLAVEVAHRHLDRGKFAVGPFFLSVEPLASTTMMATRLAEVLQAERLDPLDALSDVKKYIGRRPTLLILDSYEHLTHATPLLTELLAACPALKILVTSRERLYHQDEWVFVLSGLPVPRTAGELFSGHPQAALDLFVQRAKRVRLGFALTSEELPYVLRICQLVGGFPLGIELAAAWVGVLSPAEIAREIDRDRSFLASQQVGVPERHRSIRAVFEASWRRLGEAEQRALRRLSVFRGGFRKAAATEVSGVTIPVLTSLVDKSLLRVDATGRYDRHALLHQYMTGKLAESPEDETLAVDAHGHYYHRFLQQLERPLRGAGAKDATDAVQEELENLRLAWAWALRRGKTKEVRLSAPPLRVFFDKLGRFQEGVDFFDQALLNLRPPNRKQQAALGVVLVEQAWLVFRLGRRGVATSLAERGLDILRVLGDPKGLSEGRYILGALRLDAGEYGEARRLWREALVAARERRDLKAAAHALELLGVVEELSGDAAQAKAHYRESLDLSVHLSDKEGMVDTLNNLAALLIDVGDFAEAEPLLRRGMALAREVGAERVVPYLLDNLAKVACERCDHARAALLGQEALQMARDFGEKPLEARVLETLGRASLGTGNESQAEVYFKQSLRESWAMEALPHTLRTLLRVAELRRAQGKVEQAVSLARAVLHNLAASEPDRVLALGLLQTLSAQATAAAPNVATPLTNEPDLNLIVKQVLDSEVL